MPGRPLRLAASVLGVVALAGVVGLVVHLLLSALGAPPAAATPVSIAVAVTAALPVSDAYTPLGRGARTDALRRRGRERLLLETCLAAAAAFVSGGALAALGVYVEAVLGSFVLVVLVGVAVGYGSFLVRNRAYYGDG